MPSKPTPISPQRIVILGAQGRLGQALVRRLERNHDVMALNHDQVDLACPEFIEQNLELLEVYLEGLPEVRTSNATNGLEALEILGKDRSLRRIDLTLEKARS